METEAEGWGIETETEGEGWSWGVGCGGGGGRGVFVWKKWIINLHLRILNWKRTKKIFFLKKKIKSNVTENNITMSRALNMSRDLMTPPPTPSYLFWVVIGTIDLK